MQVPSDYILSGLVFTALGLLFAVVPSTGRPGDPIYRATPRAAVQGLQRFQRIVGWAGVAIGQINLWYGVWLAVRT